MRQRAASSQPRATHSGIDDWADIRRLRYGTLICDLDSGDVVDLLPDRSVQTVCTWLRQQPEVELLSRDRWSEDAFAQVHTLSQQGLTPVQMAARVGLGERTV